MTDATANLTRFAQNWAVTYSKSNNNNNPIADLFIGLSRPCGFRGQAYVNRSVPVKSYYDTKEDSCEYNVDGSKEHSLYYPVSFMQQELDVYD